MAGPASVAAAWPVSTKMPAPTITPTPNTMRSKPLSSRFRLNCSSSEEDTASSMLFLRVSDSVAVAPPLRARALPPASTSRASARNLEGRASLGQLRTTASSSSANLPFADSVRSSGYSPVKQASQCVSRPPRTAS